jgi:1,4-dihydroxy-2-naphthoyl-CoA hydrolase
MAIWFGTPTLEELRRMHAGTLARHLDISITELGADYLRATMPVDARTLQPAGVLHGGALVALAETLGSVGAICCVDRSRFSCVGQEINANHLRATRAGLVTGTARPFHMGRRSHVWGIEIRNDADQLVCISRITIAVLDLPPAPPRDPSGV